MKTQFKSLIAGTGMALVTAAALAQSSTGSSSSASGNNAYQSTPNGAEQSGINQENAQNQQQFFQAKNFIGEKVKNSQDQSLGTIKDIVFNHQNGQTFAAIDVGNSRYALVPWQALTVQAKGSRGKEQALLNTSKEKLQAGPNVAQNQWQELNNQTFVQSIYSHYNVQPPTGMGGTLGTGTGGTSTGSSSGTASPETGGKSGQEQK
ncbi:MAG: PRC-barrel domain-containing protein [Limisphaerales bacterium]